MVVDKGGGKGDVKVIEGDDRVYAWMAVFMEL